ncbi:flagellar hook-length control protein [Mycobacterium gordonae]|uniref:flagellar hook-length control protein n=1 Tax=Mycobacterium gordonae TaxID=1778 RepID=UPI00210B7916|nr:flagellar hook-length control protein [Mycobacterium gordonae]MCQ4360617.1 flagellar hook-length control protein [Mycobacterium gordonae]
MSTLTNSQAEVVTAAMSIAKDAAEGRLAPSGLERQALAELRELVGTVVGPGDACWELQLHIARGVLAAGGIAQDELSEWLAVERQRAGDSLPETDPVETMPEPVQGTSEPHNPEVVAAEAEPEPMAQVAPAPLSDNTLDNERRTPRRPASYDALASWNPGGTRRS